MGIFRKTSRSADALVKVEGLWSLVELVKTQWPYLLFVFSGGGMVGFATKATEWLGSIGPIAWVIGFFLGCLLVLAIGLAWEAVKYWKLRRQQISVSLSKGFNPLLTRFETQRVPLPEMFNPEYISAKKKEFIDCDLYGPAILYATGCNFSGVGFSGCQIVVMRDNAVVTGGVLALEQATILRGTMRNVTLLMTKDQYDDLPGDLKEFVPLING
jgi:hypothetical protein